MVFKKQINPTGKYIDTTGTRFDVLQCERTESKEWYQTGAYQEITVGNGQTVQIPVWASRVVINKGWDSFESLEAALQAYGVDDELRH